MLDELIASIKVHICRLSSLDYLVISLEQAELLFINTAICCIVKEHFSCLSKQPVLVVLCNSQ